MSWRDVPKPPQIAALPTDPRGYPVFFTIQPPAGAALDFRVLNLTNHRRCAKERLCGICGQRLGYWLWFIGGPMCLQNRVFGDAPMHRECAEYALDVCPFLSHSTMQYKLESSDKVADTETDQNVITARPDRILLYQTRQYTLTPAPGGKPVFRVAPPTALEWRTADGKPLGLAPL